MYAKSQFSLLLIVVLTIFLALHYLFSAAEIPTPGQARSAAPDSAGKPADPKRTGKTHAQVKEEKPVVPLFLYTSAVKKVEHEEGKKQTVEIGVKEPVRQNKRQKKTTISKSNQTLESTRPNEAQKRANERFIQEVDIDIKDVMRLDLRKPSGLTSVQADRLLKGTGLEGLGKAFVKAEKQYQVNAYYLIAHAAWESAWGKSRLSREKNNLFGFMAYDQSPHRSAKGFKTKEEGILFVADYIRINYLSENGKYYHGPHLQGMNVRYATDENWSRGIGWVMKSLARKTKQAWEQAA